MTPGQGSSGSQSQTARRHQVSVAHDSTAEEGSGRDRVWGAYGLRILGVDVPAAELVRAPAHWPALELRVRVTPAPPREPEHINGSSAHLVLRAGGSVIVDRVADRATFTLGAPPTPSALVHPHLASVAAVCAHWRGRDGFHAGAFVLDGGVWALLGDKGAGKSSTLAALADLGVPIVCDDVLILDGRTAFAGPRSIDLRGDAAGRLGVGRPLGRVGQRERWRVPLPPIEPELPFRGWVTVGWAPETKIVAIRGSDRLRELLRHRALRVPPPAMSSMVELARQPFVEFTRPREWRSLKDALDRLLAGLSGGAEPGGLQ
jgi:hypothetical protein